MMVSIITINYNNSAGLESTKKSVISQQRVRFEYLVIDGNSTDGSKDVLEAFKHNIDYVVSETDRGIYHAMNKGIKAATGTYLLFLNSGDVLLNEQVLYCASPYLKTGLDIYYGDLQYVEAGNTHRAHFPEFLDFKYFFKASLPHPASFIKRSLFDEVFYYNEALDIVSDWEFFICAICKYNASYQHLDLVVSDFEPGGISWDPKYKLLQANERRECLQKHFPRKYIIYKTHQRIANKLSKLKSILKPK